MDNNAVQENPVPDKSEQRKLLENIVLLGASISAAYKSIRIVGFLIMVAAFAYGSALS